MRAPASRGVIFCFLKHLEPCPSWLLWRKSAERMQRLGSISHFIPRRRQRLRMRKMRQTTMCGGIKKASHSAEATSPDTNPRQACEWDRVNFRCFHSNGSPWAFRKNKSPVRQGSGLRPRMFPNSPGAGRGRAATTQVQGTGQAAALGLSPEPWENVQGHVPHVSEI